MNFHFQVDTKVQGMLFAQPWKVFPIYKKEFHAGLLESSLLLKHETVLRTPVSSGSMKRSIVSEVRGEGLAMEAAVGSNMKAALPIELGARPHMPPQGPIELWVKREGITMSFRGTQLGIRNIAYLIARSIKERGLEGHFMFKEAFEASLSRIEKILSAAQARVIKEIA